MEKVDDAAFGPLDRIGQLTMRNLDIDDSRASSTSTATPARSARRRPDGARRRVDPTDADRRRSRRSDANSSARRVAASRRARSTIVSTIDVLVVGVGAAADRAEAVERRHADGSGEVAVAATTDGDADDRGEADRRRSDSATANSVGRRRLRHRGRLMPAGHLDRRRPGRSDDERRHRRFDALLLAGSLTRTSTRTRGLGRHDVVGRAGRRRPSASPSCPCSGSTERRRSGEHLVRGLDERVDRPSPAPARRARPGRARRPRTCRCPCGRSSAHRRRRSARAPAPRRTPSARSSINARDVVEPTSSSDGEQQLDAVDGRRARRRRGWPARCRAFMSNTPGPVARPSSTANGRAASVPMGNTVSWWPTTSTRGVAAARPVHVRAGRPVDEVGRPTEPVADQRRRRPRPIG